MIEPQSKCFSYKKKSLSLSEIKVDRIIADERVSWNRTTFMSNTAPETQPKIEKNFAVIFHLIKRFSRKAVVWNDFSLPPAYPPGKLTMTLS